MLNRPKKNSNLKFIDLFAGAGGLSEGFLRAGYQPIAHVEADPGAAATLKTREAFHSLRAHGDLTNYNRYIKGNIDRDQLYESTFSSAKSCVINKTIEERELTNIFDQIEYISSGEKADIVIGGPPCQAYSLAGRARSNNNMAGDDRNYLFFYYARFLQRYRPKYFVFENVVGLISAYENGGTRYFDMMNAIFHQIGYSVEWHIVSADEHGVPQKRRRVIIVGRQGKESGFFPQIEKVKTDYLVGDVIGDLPALKAGQGTPHATKIENTKDSWLNWSGLRSNLGFTTWHDARPHNQRDRQIFFEVVKRWEEHRQRLNYNELPEELKTHKNRVSFLDRFKVVAADIPASHTVVAHIAKDGNYYIHPDREQNRSLTPREVARLQTFPDDYHFESSGARPSRTSAFKQIGNAVPVLLSEKIAKALMEEWR